jgi:ubiquinone/menaquinone biosynthesis C-methylase UbiE
MKAMTYENGSAPEVAIVSGKGQPTPGQNAAHEWGASTKQRGGRMDRSAKFWDRIAKRYARKPVANEAAYERKLKVTQDYLKPHMEVLEFGCGTGTTALIHAPFVKHITGIDISRNMIEIARKKAESAGVKNVTFRQSSIDDLEAPDDAYDVVMGHSILHLLENKETVIAKVHRMLKPGGVFVSSTVCLGGQVPVMRAILPVGRFLGLLPMVKFFTAEELEGSLTKAGFRIDYRWQPEKSMALFIVARKASAVDSHSQIVTAGA